MARCVTYIGIFILIACSFSTIRSAMIANENEVVIEALKTKEIADIKASELPKIIERPIIAPVHIQLETKGPDIVKLPPVIDTFVKHQHVPLADDPAKLKKQEELLRRLENQTKEHDKLMKQQKQILEEMKKHVEEHKVQPVIEKKEPIVEPDVEYHKAVIPEQPDDQKKPVIAIDQKQDDKAKADLNNEVKKDTQNIRAEKVEIQKRVPVAPELKVEKPFNQREPIPMVAQPGRSKTFDNEKLAVIDRPKESEKVVESVVSAKLINVSEPKIKDSGDKMREPKRDILSIAKPSFVS
jgi:hypothetical protein